MKNSEEREKTNNMIEILKGIMSIKVNGKVVYVNKGNQQKSL